MGKYIGNVYKYSQSQLPTSSFKELVRPYSTSQTSLYIELTTTSAPAVRDKNQSNSDFVPKIPSRMM